MKGNSDREGKSEKQMITFPRIVSIKYTVSSPYIDMFLIDKEYEPYSKFKGKRIVASLKLLHIKATAQNYSKHPEKLESHHFSLVGHPYLSQIK